MFILFGYPSWDMFAFVHHFLNVGILFSIVFFYMQQTKQMKLYTRKNSVLLYPPFNFLRLVGGAPTPHLPIRDHHTRTFRPQQPSHSDGIGMPNASSSS